MKKVFVFTALLIFLLSMSAMVLAADQYKIGIAIPSADHGWTGGVVWWAEQAINTWEEKDPNLTFHLVTAADANEQVSQIRTLMARGIDALVVLPHTSGPLTPIVEQAKKQGIYVVVVDRGLDRNVYDVYVAGDNPGFGRKAGEQLAKAMNYEGKIVVVDGLPCVINTQRTEAFKEVIERYPKLEILAIQTGQWNPDKAFNTMQTLLQKYDHIDAVWASDDDQMGGVLPAIEQADRDDIEIVVGGGGKKQVIKEIMEGSKRTPFTITYPPSMIASSVAVAIKGVKGENFEGFVQHSLPSQIIIDSEVVNQENADEHYYPDSIY